jgi:hypothetical protein
VNELPRGWASAILSELIGPAGLFSDGDWVESKDQDPNGSIRLLQLADIGDGSFIDKSRRFINELKFDELRCTEVLENDILVARMPDPLGRACLAMPLGFLDPRHALLNGATTWKTSSGLVFERVLVASDFSFPSSAFAGRGET